MLNKADPDSDHIPKLTVPVKNLFLTNARVLILNMTIVFLNCLPKKFTNKVFFVPNLGIFIFACNFTIFFSNMTMFFQNCCLKDPNRHFWFHILWYLFLHKTSQLDKLEGVNLKCDKRFLKFQSKNTQIKHFWFQS